MELYWPYLAPMLAVCLSAGIVGLLCNLPIFRVAVVLALNWGVNTWFCYQTGIYDPWWFYLAVDSLSAWAVLYHPAGRVQSLIGYTYVGQIIIHGVYGASGSGASDLYWLVLLEIAYAQLFILGVWAGGYGGYRLWRRHRSDVAGSEGAEGVA